MIPLRVAAALRVAAVPLQIGADPLRSAAGSLCSGQRRRALDPDSPPVRLDDAARYREAEADPLPVAPARLVVTVEDVGELLGRDPRTVVRDGESDHRA